MHAASLWKVSLTMSLLFAVSKSHADELDARISSLESRMAAVKNESVKKTSGAKMASASPLIDGYGFYATADLLVWHLKEGGTDYALTLKESAVVDFLPTSGKSVRSHFNWNAGFRFGAGYTFEEHDAWDGYINFTWFQTHASDSAHAPDNQSLAPQKGLGVVNPATKMSSHWKVHYYVLDFELGRNYFVSKYLAFRPQFGIESALINQRRHYKILGEVNGLTGIFGDRVFGKNNFYGVGPRAGVQGTWYFDRHFSLNGAINGALLWGRFNCHLHETGLTSTSKVKVVDMSDVFHRIVPNVQMALGVGWDGNLFEDLYHLGVRVSYEFQYWWRQNQFLNEQQFNDGNFQSESMDLSLNGVTLDVRFDF